MIFRMHDQIDFERFKDFDHKIVVAIDGPAASGKGTLARNLASRFQFAHLDTGMLYRGLGYCVLENGGDPENTADVEKNLPAFLKKLDGDYLKTPELRTDDAGSAASKVAVMDFVRAALLDYQRDFRNIQPDDIYGVVLDGRDIGTVIYPDADIKVFVTASAEVRAQRRFDELCERGLQTDYNTVLDDIKARDARDSGRKVAPLKPADDSYVLDTSQLNTSEALAQVIDVIRGQLLDD